MTYEVSYAKSALKELKKLPPDVGLRVKKSILALSSNPRSGNVRPMVSSTAWRLRVGDYRVVYDIKDRKLVILIIKIKHRRDVYKK